MTKKITEESKTPPVTEVQPELVTPELTQKDQKEVRIIERVIENKAIAPSDAFGKLTRSQVELIKSTIAKDASDDELRMFIQVCKGAQLNPFLRQVHLVPRWDSKIGATVRTIQVGIDGFRAVAESGGQYAGNDDPAYKGELTIEYGLKEKKKVVVPLQATVTVYKAMNGQRYPFTATARWAEYYPGEKIGFQWHIRPYLMLGKCAEALALRKAFPKLLSGMYAQEEMDRTAQTDNEQKKVVDGFQTLKNALGQATPDQIEDYLAKMEKSDKYTGEQKAEFKKLAQARLDELKQPGTPE